MIPGAVQPVIDLTKESQEVFQPLPLSPVDIQLEDKVVFKKDNIEEQDNGKGLCSRLFAKTEPDHWYTTRTGRTVKPAKSYLPSLGSQKKYEGKVFLTETIVCNNREKQLRQDQVKMPTAEHLFQVKDSANKPSNDESMTFHNATAKALYLYKRSCLDLQTAVSFLTTQVKESNDNDWKKLFRLMRNFKAIAELGLTLRNKGEGYKLQMVDWCCLCSPSQHVWSYSSNIEHGKGSVFSKSTKQKINTTSSIEAELVGTYEVMLKIVWNNYVLEEQGYHGPWPIIYQDNLSAILLEEVPKAAQREPNISTLDTTLLSMEPWRNRHPVLLT